VPLYSVANPFLRLATSCYTERGAYVRECVAPASIREAHRLHTPL
jgi:hypothetical protein